MVDPDIVVVGAGAAGLSAAGVLRRAGRSVLVLEAHGAIGGRARTVKLHGAAFDEGATWLHEVDRNPLAALARASGDLLHPGHEGGSRLFVDGRNATPAELLAYDHASERWQAGAEQAIAALADDADDALSVVGDRLDPADPWLPNLEMWEGAIIAAADADLLSIRDWHANRLDGADLRPDGGVGALLCRHLGPKAGPVRCGVAATGIDWSVPGRIVVETGQGRVRASGCIVTVSTGVLRDGRIGFTPALPDAHRAALDGLPMGLLSKLALPVAEDARFGLPDGVLLEQRLGSRRTEAMLLWLRPDGVPLLTGFLGGRHAWSYAGREHESLREMRDRLRALLGSDALRGVADTGHASCWGSDPLFGGSYAYARPGHAGARAALGTPFADGRVVLAGEATDTQGLSGTVGGAINQGARAAGSMLALLSRR